MFGLGFFEIFLLGTIALIVLGPDKLVLAMRQLGKWYALFLHNKDRLQREVGTELDLVALQRQIKADVETELAKLRAAEAALKAELNTLKKDVDFTKKDVTTEKITDISDTLDPAAADRRGLLGLDTALTPETTTESTGTENLSTESTSDNHPNHTPTAPKNAWQAIAAFGQNTDTKSTEKPNIETPTVEPPSPPNNTADSNASENHTFGEVSAQSAFKDAPEITKPMNGRFFLLGEYDKKRRLPPPPFLANTKADALLYETPNLYPSF